jgi:hypothetical protein
VVASAGPEKASTEVAAPPPARAGPDVAVRMCREVREEREVFSSYVCTDFHTRTVFLFAI